MSSLDQCPSFQLAKWREHQLAWIQSAGLRHQLLVEEEERRITLMHLEQKQVSSLYARMRFAQHYFDEKYLAGSSRRRDFTA